MMMKQPPWPSIVFFDGICLLCNRSVDFLIRYDKKGKLKFASLQESRLEEFISAFTKNEGVSDSIIFLENGKPYYRSTAILKIIRLLPYPWKLASIFGLVPEKLRDQIYDYIANNRYRWFGKRESCRIPDKSTKGRFI